MGLHTVEGLRKYVTAIESLKKRRDGIYRSVPVPPALLETLDMVHGIREQQAGFLRIRSLT